MKIKLLAIIAFLFAANSIQAQSATDKWPALKEFHTVIAATFHPAEEGNLEPTKTRAQELANKGADLLKSNIPAEYRTDAILKLAEKLQTKSRALYKLVLTNAPDAEIKTSITDLHTTYHSIAGLCNDEKK